MDPVLTQLVTALVGLGPGGLIAAFMTYQWREERAERRELQEKNMNLLQQTITSRVELASALERLTDKIK